VEADSNGNVLIC